MFLDGTRLAAEAGEIEGVYPLPDGPWIWADPATRNPHHIFMTTGADVISLVLNT